MSRHDTPYTTVYTGVYTGSTSSSTSSKVYINSDNTFAKSYYDVTFDKGAEGDSKEVKSYPNPKSYVADVSKIQDWEIVKLLDNLKLEESKDEIVVYILGDKWINELSKMSNRLAMSSKYPFIKRIIPLEMQGYTNSDTVAKVKSKLQITAYSKGLTPVVLLADTFEENMSVMQVAMVINLGVHLIRTTIQETELEKNTIPYLPIFVLNKVISEENLEEGAVLAGMSNIEKVNSENVTYFELNYEGDNIL